MAPVRGLLFVTMQPADDLPLALFHDWYNNEHGPTRLRLPYFMNGFRYKSRDNTQPQFLASYDVEDVEMLGHESYTSLRGPDVKTAREQATMAKIAIDRRIYEQLHSTEVRELAARECSDLLVAIASPATGTSESDILQQHNEYAEKVAGITGWLRTRLFKTSKLDTQHEPEYLVLIEYDHASGIDDPTSQSLLHASRDGSDGVQRLSNWDHFYSFGPAPKDLQSLTSSHAVAFTSNDHRTKTFPSAEWPALESYVTTSDGALIPYRLEGSPSPDAPVIVLVNSILVEWGIWDGFVNAFAKKTQTYRILRYNTRGRTSKAGEKEVTLDVLASDLIELLDSLNVSKVAVAAGVSLGGATVLNATIHCPERIPVFVACDTNATAPASNPKAWGDRIVVAEKEAAKGADGQPVVGAELAEMTVRRWFVEASYDGGKMEKEVNRVKNMVNSNDLEGFRRSVRALYQYEMKAHLSPGKVRGTFVVGEGDGVLPKTMSEMADQYGDGATLEIVPGAGHLPMVEKPELVADIVLRTLES